LSSGEYLPGSLQGKISSDGCLKKEQMVVSAIASTPQNKRGAFVFMKHPLPGATRTGSATAKRPVVAAAALTVSAG
ncbi:TPA: hypothetical protein ACHIXR_005047, partial [Escherichia coli]